MREVAGGSRVGIPRGLFWYYMPNSYKVFWEALGFVVVQSPPTNREIFEEGLRLAHDELCLPVKVLHGHIAFLRNKVDFIFLPRIVSVKRKGKKRYGCPKFIGLPELVKSSVPFLPPIISVDIDADNGSFADAFLKLKNVLGLSQSRMRDAVEEMLRLEKRYTQNGVGHPGEERVRIGVVGHPYILYDTYLSMDLLGKLTPFGIDYTTSAEVPAEIIDSELKPEIDLYWIYERELVGAASFFADSTYFDGILHCVSFGCGPGSVMMEMVERKVIAGKDFPFFTLIMDENTGEVGLLTRLETFCDIVKMRKR